MTSPSSARLRSAPRRSKSSTQGGVLVSSSVPIPDVDNGMTYISVKFALAGDDVGDGQLKLLLHLTEQVLT
jgi:hypothetical protein